MLTLLIFYVKKDTCFWILVAKQGDKQALIKIIGLLFRFLWRSQWPISTHYAFGSIGHQIQSSIYFPNQSKLFVNLHYKAHFHVTPTQSGWSVDLKTKEQLWVLLTLPCPQRTITMPWNLKNQKNLRGGAERENWTQIWKLLGCAGRNMQWCIFLFFS
jgi:hypothetical protein